MKQWRTELLIKKEYLQEAGRLANGQTSQPRLGYS
jgi:hypothetical protein